MSTQPTTKYALNQMHATTEAVINFYNQPNVYIHLSPFPEYTEPMNQNRFGLGVNPSVMAMFGPLSTQVWLEFRYRLQSMNKDTSVHFCVSLLNAKGEKSYTKDYVWDSTQQKPNAFFINRTDAYQHLSNRKLHIHCEVDVLGDSTGDDRALAQPQADIVNAADDSVSTILLESGKFSDFTVVIGPREYAVHKLILSTRSEVFAAMFEHETKETKENRVIIEDISEDVFELLLRYIYTGKVGQLGQLATELFVAADKYQLKHLKSVCQQSMATSISIESAAEILILADMHNLTDLRSKCIQFINKHSTQVMVTEGWKHIKTRLNLMVDLYEASQAN